jgi:hypothetical protein
MNDMYDNKISVVKLIVSIILLVGSCILLIL